MVSTTRRPSPRRRRWMRKPRNTNPSSIWVMWVFSTERVIFNCSTQQLADLGSQRLGVGLGAVHEHDEVVGETHQPVVRQPFAAAVLPPPRRAHVPFPDLPEVPVQDRQVDVGQQRGSDPTLRRAGQARREPAVLSDDPGPQKPADQAQHLPIGDALGDQTHQDLVIDIVEAGGDVPFDHPLIALGGEFVDLGDGILGPPSRPIPVTVRVEVDLEDRFQDQLEGHLRHPIPQGGDAEQAQFPALLRYRHLPDRQRGEGAVPQRGAQLLQERQHPDVLFDVAAGDRVHAGCLGAPVAGDPLPGHQQGGLVADQVEQITEPLVRFGPCPSVQLALVIEYPTLRPIQGRLVDGAAIQRLFATTARC